MSRYLSNRCRKGRLPFYLPRLQTPRRRCEEAQDPKSQISSSIFGLTAPTETKTGNSRRERGQEAQAKRGKVSIAPFQEIQACGQQQPPSSERFSSSRTSERTEWYACSRDEWPNVISARSTSTAEHLRRQSGGELLYQESVSRCTSARSQITTRPSRIRQWL